MSRQPGRRCRSSCGARQAIGPKNTRRSTSSGQRPANAPTTMVPQECAIIDTRGTSWRSQIKRSAASNGRAIRRAAERRMRPCRLRHFRIRVRLAETVEIKPPDVKAGSTQGVAPGSSAEAVRDRQCRRKRPAMDIEDRAAERFCVPPCRQVAQEQ